MLQRNINATGWPAISACRHDRRFAARCGLVNKGAKRKTAAYELAAPASDIRLRGGGSGNSGAWNRCHERLAAWLIAQTPSSVTSRPHGRRLRDVLRFELMKAYEYLVLPRDFLLVSQEAGFSRDTDQLT